jgi:peptidoglycan/xylan/chitin deacetylase (PgdA/CDA1 family)
MKTQTLNHLNFLFILFILTISCTEKNHKPAGYTEITKWQDGKLTAVSLTYDDGSINQFKVALPIMNRLQFPATFFIITGDIEGSQYHRKFIGRPVEEIIKETAEIPTNADNLFERASAIRVIGDSEIREYHTKAGELWESGKSDEAFKTIDEAYAIVRSNPKYPVKPAAPGHRQLSWDTLKEYAAQGHEFASHTITHPRLSVLDEPNLIYELDKSKEDILNHLGPEYTFSVECPYGTEDERAVNYALERYPLTRNLMPDPFVKELNRGSRLQPGTFDDEYVQWQRGALSNTSLDKMRSWIDTCAAHNNIWLVLVFHGVDGIGWEAIPGDTLATYFKYIKSNEDKVWVATFKDVAKYMRERMNAEVTPSEGGGKITIVVRHNLDPALYDLPLTLKTYVPSGWESAELKQDGKTWFTGIKKDEEGRYVQYHALPNAGEIELTRVEKE